MRFNSFSLVFAFAGLGCAAVAEADGGPQPVTVHLDVYSQYVFRGLTQSNERPVLQGGADYAHASGLYAGAWLSTISWFPDTNPGNSVSLEWDFYTGFRKTWPGGISADVGYLRYEYPGAYPVLPLGTVKPNTDEGYAAIGWKWATLKYSYALGTLFGVEDSRGSDYVDLTISVPLSGRISLAAHAGRQTYKGRGAAARLGGTTNDALYTYNDYRTTVTYAFAAGWSASATYTQTDAPDAGYTVLGKNLGDDQLILGVTRSL